MTDAARLAAHEAGHACACVMLGVPVQLIDVAGDAMALGRVHHHQQLRTRGDARDRMLIILCGPIESAVTWDDVPSWPLRRDASTDERNLATLADVLELDAAGYADIVREAIDLTLTPQYRMLHVAITGMLDYTPRIGPQLLARLHTIANRNRSD